MKQLKFLSPDDITKLIKDRQCPDFGTGREDKKCIHDCTAYNLCCRKYARKLLGFER